MVFNGFGWARGGLRRFVHSLGTATFLFAVEVFGFLLYIKEGAQPGFFATARGMIGEIA